MCQQIMRVLKAEQARDNALSALEDTNRNLDQRIKERTQELEVANQQLEAFSYSVSHDLRAPLRSIAGFSRMLADDAEGLLSQESRSHLERVRLSTQHMEELIDGLLEMARVVKTEMHRTTVDLTATVRELEKEFRDTQPSRSVEVSVDDEMHAVGDPVLLRSVLANLIGNAWKFTTGRPHAQIQVGKLQSGTETTIFFVKDNGVGFDMKYADKLFGPFQRLHTQDQFPGTGVGLATVQRIVQKHGGHIWAESQPDRGATFFFTLSSQS